MISVDDMQKLEALSEKYGISKLMLMEHAGKGLAKFLEKKFDLFQKTAVLFCGNGNNGGDGFVAARHLRGSRNRPIVRKVSRSRDCGKTTRGTFWAGVRMTVAVRGV